MGHTGLARLSLAHWCYRTRTKPAEVREAPTSIDGRGCHITMFPFASAFLVNTAMINSTHATKLSIVENQFQNDQRYEFLRTCDFLHELHECFYEASYLGTVDQMLFESIF